MIFLIARTWGTRSGLIAAACYGLHPLSAGWHRAGASEPAALLFGLLCFLAIARATGVGVAPGNAPDAATHPRRGSSHRWWVAAWLAALLAINVRIENALLVVGLAICFGWRRYRGSWRYSTVLLVTGGPLALCLAVHVTTLGRYYLTGQPESSFSLWLLPSHALDNARFLRAIGPGSILVLVLFATLGWLRSRLQRHVSHGWWMGLLGWQGASMLGTLVYSTGMYSLPGGSRFLLAPLAALSLAAGVGLGMFGRRHPWVTVTGMLVYCVLLPRADVLWHTIDARVTSPSLEHAAILRWSQALPRDAIVVTKLPYLWDNLGRFAVNNDGTEPRNLSTSAPTYVHIGLFDQRQLDWQGAPLVDSVQTDRGSILLIGPLSAAPRAR